MRLWIAGAPLNGDKAAAQTVSEYFDAATSIYDHFYDCLVEIDSTDSEIDAILQAQSDIINNDEFAAIFEAACKNYCESYDLSEETQNFVLSNNLTISSEYTEFAAIAANTKQEFLKPASEGENEDDWILHNLKYFAAQPLRLKESDLDKEEFEQMKKEMIAFAASQGLNCSTPAKAKGGLQKMLKAQTPAKTAKPAKAAKAIRQPQKPDWSDAVHAAYDLLRISEDDEWNSIHSACLKAIGKSERIEFVFDDAEKRTQSISDFLATDNSLVMQAFRASNDPTGDHSELCEKIGIEHDIQTLNGWLPAASDSYIKFAKDYGVAKPVQGEGKKSRGSQKPENLTYPLILSTSEFIEETMRTQKKLVDLRGVAKTQKESLRATQSEIKKQEGILEELAVKQFKEIDMPLYEQQEQIE